jgi:hypothetical protein
MSVRYGVEGMTPAMRDVCKRRVEPLLREYGQQIRFVSIETLCASCYLQGISDLAQVKAQLAETKEEV